MKEKDKGKKRKIAVITGTRAEYGLLYWLMREIAADPDLELQIIVTGMHLSPEFGLTYQLIEKDGFSIDTKIEMLLSSDTAVGVTKSISLGILGFCDAFVKLSPDIIVLLGDRFESLAVAQTALIQKIPIAHIHGGELSEGAIDDAIRHAITKMSHLHFVAADPYRKRVIQLGEHPDRVFNVGAPGLERIKRMNLLSQAELEEKIEFKLGKINFLITYHPATLDINQNAIAIEALFQALDSFPEAKLIFTKANADEAGRFINSRIDEYVKINSHRAKSFITLGELNYLSLLQFVQTVLGNSSSGIIEVPFFGKPTINIGNRQDKRLRINSIIDCNPQSEDIITAIHQSLSPTFLKSITKASAYKQDATSIKIKNIIKQTNLENIVTKQFYDLVENK